MPGSLRVLVVVGGVDITHVLQLLDLARRIAVGHPDFIRGHFIKPYLSFFLLTDVYLTPELRKDAPSKWINWKLTLAVEMVNFNRNSSIMRVDILDKESAVPLVTCLTKAMYVNAKTRRRDLDLPQWVQSSTSECPPVKMTYDVPPSIPEHAHASSYTVRHSDMDYNNHTNHVIYTRVCIDAASIACRHGSFRVFKNHMYDYDIVQCSSFFKNESKFGDELIVHVWQDDVRDDILHFVIRNNNQDIYLCKTTFLIPITSKY